MFGFGKKKEKIVVGANLIEGLPLSKNADLIVAYEPTGVTFATLDKQSFTLSMEKITSIHYYDETELEKVVTQSAPGVILGAAMFGVVGAMIGGRVKTKDVKNTKYFLLFTYEDKQVLIESKAGWELKKISDAFDGDKSVEPTTISL